MARKNLTQPPEYRDPVARRRARGGARREISASLTLRVDDGRSVDAWALNISRGGIRIITEELLQVGQKLEIEGYDPDKPDAPPREAKVVWVQEEPDGAVVGLEFLDVPNAVPPSMPARPVKRPSRSSNPMSSSSSSSELQQQSIPEKGGSGETDSGNSD